MKTTTKMKRDKTVSLCVTTEGVLKYKTNLDGWHIPIITVTGAKNIKVLKRAVSSLIEHEYDYPGERYIPTTLQSRHSPDDFHGSCSFYQRMMVKNFARRIKNRMCKLDGVEMETFKHIKQDVLASLCSLGLDILQDVCISRGKSIRASGGYYPSKVNGGRDKITISIHSPYPRLTLLHEVGHYVDARLLGDQGYFHSVSLPGFMEYVRSTASYKLAVQATPAGEWFEDDEEIFAGAFAQWVISKDGCQPEIVEELERARDHDKDYTVHTWGDEEFKPIAEMMDEIMKGISNQLTN